MTSPSLRAVGAVAAALVLVACGEASQREPSSDRSANAVGQPKGMMGAVETPIPAPIANKAESAGSASVNSAAQSGVSATAQPVAGSPQRAAIMDALRPAIERKLGGAVEFVVRRVAVQDGWALVIADPQRPGGGRIDPRRHFPHEVIEFMDGLTVNGILRFSGGSWTLVDHAIGPTDVWYCGVEGPPRSLTGC